MSWACLMRLPMHYSPHILSQQPHFNDLPHAQFFFGFYVIILLHLRSLPGRNTRLGKK
jgi:hypothetical protein